MLHSKDDHTHVLKNVRLSFPDLFTRSVFDGQEGKYGATFIIDPVDHESDLSDLTESIDVLTAQIKVKRLAADKIALKDGDESGREEYEGKMILRANTDLRPVCMDHTGREYRDDEEGIRELYSGCYVTAKVRLWPQNNNWGKRINCELLAVAKKADGPPLGGRRPTTHDEAVDGMDLDGADVDEMLAE